MSVPLDRLYNFLRDVCNRHDVVIYRFFPHGSRKITDLIPLTPPSNASIRAWVSGVANDNKYKKFMFIHDQEPLNFNLYLSPTLADELQQYRTNDGMYEHMDEYLTEMHKKLMVHIMPELNIKIAEGVNLWRVPVLLAHSEQRSKNLQKYENIDCIGVYWWCHALIARDWFRYAEHDPALSQRSPQKDFLIYNRAWSGTREYRLKFAELLVDNQLTNYCVMGFNKEDNGDYRSHHFQNPVLQIRHCDLEKYFFYNTSTSAASADYEASDYQSTELEVVLETLFDDERLHLTEKILRPIACGHPFILVSTIGSLEYLRHYGFKTFGNLIDENYDTIHDPVERLQAIVKELRRIADLPYTEKTQLYSAMREVALYNRQLFFSAAWQETIINEYRENFNKGLLQLEQRCKKLVNQS